MATYAQPDVGLKETGSAGTATAGSAAGSGSGVPDYGQLSGQTTGGAQTQRPGTGAGAGMTSAAQVQAMLANQVNQIGYDPNRRCPIAIDPVLTENLLPGNLSVSISQLASQLTAPGQSPGCINVGQHLENMVTPEGNNNVAYFNRLMEVAGLANQCSQSRDGIIDSIMGLAMQFTSGPMGLAVLGGSALYRLSGLFSSRQGVSTSAIYNDAQRGSITNMLQAGLTCTLNNTMNTTACWEMKKRSIDATLRILPEVDPATSICENQPAPETPAAPAVAESSFASSYRIIEEMYSCFDKNINASPDDKQQCVTCNLTTGDGSYRVRFDALKSIIGRDAATILAARDQQLPAIAATARDYHNQRIVDLYSIIEESTGMGPSDQDVRLLINHCYYGDITRSISASNVRAVFDKNEIEDRNARNRHDRASAVCQNIDKCFQGSNWYNSTRFQGVDRRDLVCRKIYEIDNNGIEENIDDMTMNLMSRITVNRNKNQIACNGYLPEGQAGDSSGTSRQ